MKNKVLFFISIFILLILSIGIVSASDDLGDSNNVIADSSDSQSISNIDLAPTSSESDSPDEINGDNVLSSNANALSSTGSVENALSPSDSKNSLKSSLLTSDINVSGNTFNDIQKAINNAKNNDIIYLNGTYTGSGKVISIDKAITIQGRNNAILDAKNLSGIFNIKSKNVILKDLTFQYSKVNSNSAAIYSKYGFNISGCKFRYNYGENYSSIYAIGGNCIISNCNFSSNHNNMGLIRLENATASISNSLFKSNAYYSKDRWVYEGLIYSLKSKLTIESSNFMKNKLIAVNLEEGSCTITKSNFTDSAQTAINSWCTNLNLKGSNFINLSSYSLYGMGKKVTVDACNFINNTGIPIYLEAFEDDVYRIKNSKFINNKANPSAIYISFDATSKIINCTFKNNYAKGSRSVIFFGSRNTNTIIKNNKTYKYHDVTALNNNLKAFAFVKANAKSIKISYKSAKKFSVKVYYAITKKGIGFYNLWFDIKKSKKLYKSMYAETNKKGIAKINVAKLPVGTYKVYIGSNLDGDDFEYDIPTMVRTIKITKAKTKVKAPAITAKRGKSKKFKITLKHKETKKALSGVKIKLRIYTGKKYKTYTVKTNKKGIAKFNVKKLKRGKHKVIIRSGNKNIYISAKSRIRIR